MGGRGEELGAIKGEENIIRIYNVRKNPLLSEKRKNLE